MRVLITGATGFAGRHLASLCASEGCSVTGIGRRAATDVELSADLAGYEAIDLTDPEQTDDMVRSAAPERVFHLAADASVASSWNNPARVITNNICSTLNLLEAVRRHGTDVRLLVACSGEEYGEPEKVPVTEDHPLKPKNPYAVSKASLDLTAGFYADTYGMHVVRTRAFNHAGPGQSDSYVVSNLAHQIAEAEATHENEAVAEMLTGNPDVRRDFTDVRDVVRAYWLALERAEAGVYNVCSGRAATITEILAGLASNSPLEVERRTDPSRVREHDVLEVRGSHEKLTGATGWKPEIPLEQTLRDTLDWWRAMLATGVPT